MSDKYILVGQTPVPCEDLMEWARWYETADRHVFDESTVTHRVSTVFLGLDHNFQRLIMGVGEPLLFETMVFCQHESKCDLDGEMDRYSTWSEAEAGHHAMVERVKAETGRRTA